MISKKTSLHSKFLTLLVLVSSLCFLSFLNSAIAKDKVYNLTIQSAFPRGDVSVPLLDVFAKSAEKRSNGQVKIKWYAAPEIVPPEQLFDSVNMGVLDMQMSVGVYWSGTMPIGDVSFGLPMSYNMGWVNGYEAKANALKDLFFNEGLIEVLREEYAKRGHYYLGIFTSGPTVLLSTKPITSSDDWKGKIVRTDGQNIPYFENMGAQATTIPGTDTYLALKLGTVDMAEWDISAFTGMNWQEVAPYWITGMESYLAMEFTVSMDVWNGLPPHLQEAIQGAYEDYYKASIELYKKEFVLVEKLINEKKITVSEIDQSSKDAFTKKAAEIWDLQAQKDPGSAKAIAIIKQWIDKNQQ